MPDICGFLDSRSATAADSTLEGMLRLLPQKGHSHVCQAIGSQAAVAVRARVDTVPYAAERVGDLLVTYEGRLYWSKDTPPEISNAPTIAESLARAYLTLEHRFLSLLRGTYAIAIVAPGRQQALLAIDRMGIRPLAYGVTASGLAFSSNTLAVTGFPGITGSLSPQAIHNYFFFHVVPSPETIFLGVSKLPPAHFAIYNRGDIRVERYWAPEFQSHVASSELLFSELKPRLEQAMERQFDNEASATTGAFLSGGLDSSTVVGLLSERCAPPVTAYTIGFNAEGYDEIPFARQSASHYGSRLCEYYVTPRDVADAIGIIAEGYDEPFGNASAIPAYFCARLARDDGHTILMAGDGGDEIFAGNERYLTQKAFSYFEQAPYLIQTLLKTALLTNSFGDSFPPLRKIRSYVHQAAIPLPERLNTYNFLHRTPLEKIFEHDFLSSIDRTLPNKEQRAVFSFPQHADHLQRMLFLDWKYTLADNDLRKVNRTADLTGIEVRYPLLDDDLVEFSTSIPSGLLIRGNALRDFYKRSLANFLPPHTIAKKKHGFGLPFGIWLANDQHLNELARDCLGGMKQRHILKPEYIDDLIRAQRTEHAAYYGVMIWVIIMLEMWLRMHKLQA